MNNRLLLSFGILGFAMMMSATSFAACNSANPELCVGFGKGPQSQTHAERLPSNYQRQRITSQQLRRNGTVHSRQEIRPPRSEASRRQSTAHYLSPQQRRRQAWLKRRQIAQRMHEAKRLRKMEFDAVRLDNVIRRSPRRRRAGLERRLHRLEVAIHRMQVQLRR